MHQPLIPAGGMTCAPRPIISNLQHMMDAPATIGDNHNAPVFHWCYKRMGEFIPQLVDEGNQPRVMLDYSGTLLHGPAPDGARRRVRRAAHASPAIRAIAAASSGWAPRWGHAVAPSTPVQDYRLHVRAWQHHFAALFGLEALQRVRGFSPAEMALPNHPDVAYEFVRTLRDCGYRWVLVQEHTVERPDGGGARSASTCRTGWSARNSRGETAEIIAIIKTQGSDTKLVGQMQPYYEAKACRARSWPAASVPPLVTQIADGENGGVMMNEFPPKYLEAMRECSGSDAGDERHGVPGAFVRVRCGGERPRGAAAAAPEADLGSLRGGRRRARLEAVIADLRKEDSRFNVEGGSWTNDISWVRGYERLLGPMEEVSSLFYEKVLKPGLPSSEPRYRNALFHLLCCQTSCYRYWGQGVFVDYGTEICRRAREVLVHDF